MKRIDGRESDSLRPVRITYHVFDYAAGSVLFELGKTKVMCAVTLQTKVPPFLKGKKTGWLHAEYAMLPASTQIRSERDQAACVRNGRNVEISRLIGRSLRTIVNTTHIGERTITIDCDVIQADGSTRTACITGAFLALQEAEKKWLAEKVINEPILIDYLAAVSVGVYQGEVLLDLNFAEDSIIDADFNFVLTRSGAIVEVQGSAEKFPLPATLFSTMLEVAYKGTSEIFNHIASSPEKVVKPPFNGIRFATTR